MQLRLDPASPVPLYHQIVEAVRYRIATGRLAPGASLPSVRSAAASWDVNLHTVRRAYGDLADAGFVDSRPGRGTRVLDGRSRRRPRSALRDAFLARVIGEARQEHDLSADDLAGLLANWSAGATPPDASVVHVLECSWNQARAHASELEQYFDVEARPWSLEQTGSPPEGALVATYFHYNELRRRWPRRLDDVRFATIRVAPQLLDELHRLGAGAGKRTRLPLCELEPAIADNIAADVRALLPEDEFQVVPTVVASASELLTPRRRTPLLFSPRVWGLLADEERAHPLALEVRYAFPAEELDALGRHFHWARISPAERLRGRAARVTP